MTTPRTSKHDRLTRAGYMHLSGWVPVPYGKRVMQQVRFHLEDVEKVLAEPPRPRGRPKKPETETHNQ